MSAQLQSQSNSFSAYLALAAGVSVTINAPTLDDLAGVVAKLQGAPAANDAAATTKAKPAGAETKPPVQEPPAGNGSASTGTQASAQPAVGGSAASSGDAPRPTYDDVKARVLSLSKLGRQHAIDTLGAFKTVKGEKVDHGNKLQLEDYPAFIAAADKLLGAKSA